MKKRIVFIGLIGLVAIALLIVGIHISSNQTTPIKNARERYEKAIGLLPNSYNLTVNKETTIQVGDKQYSETSLIELQHNGENQITRMDESITSGSATTVVSEIYTGDILYLTVQDQQFASAITQETAKHRYVPAAALNSTLYQDCTGQKKNGKIEIKFSSPTEAEAWTIPTGGELITASGCAKLNKSNKLKSITYSIEFYYGNAIVSKNYDIRIHTDKQDGILIPEDTSAYTTVEYIDGPILLEKMCGLLLQEDTLSTKITESMFCGAFGDQLIKSENLTINGLDPVDVSIETTISQSNISHGDAPIITTQFQQFVFGTYTATANNQPIEGDPNITEENMREYCQNIVLGTLLLPQYIQNTTFSQADNQFIVTYQANEAFAQIIVETVCYTLYNDPTALSARATDHTIEDVSCIVSIDKATGLPNQAKILYSGYYTIDEVPYPLKYEITQTYE